jgi:aerobic C4-dicarboxylate transport protein
MSEARAITNFIGNGVATIAISNNEKMFNIEQMKLALAS